MASQQPLPAESVYRNEKGEWRTPYPVPVAPIFMWPPRPKALVKWALSYPGFLWPWNAIYLLITVVTWFYCQPALTRCAELRWDWIAQMLLRNLVLIWLVAGGWHLLLYTFKVQGTDRKYDARWLRTGDRNFTFKNQLGDNIFWSCISGVPIWTAYEVAYMWAAANHHVPYVSWQEHPVYGAVWLCAIPFWREFHFYLIHRAIHWKPLYPVMPARRSQRGVLRVEQKMDRMRRDNPVNQHDAEVQEMFDRMHRQAGPRAGIDVLVVEIVDGLESPSGAGVAE